jgi:hypothetical protein
MTRLLRKGFQRGERVIMNATRRICAALALSLLVHRPAAAQTVLVDTDQVGRKAYTLALVGNIGWYYNRANPNERIVSWNFSSYQADRTYRAYCVGVQVMLGTRRVSSTGNTVGGQVSWSLSGPSVGVNASHTQTTNNGVDGEGFSWRCPANAQAYQRLDANGAQTFHSMVQGRLEYFAVRACMALNPRDPYNRWCTPWDVNSYGGQ